MTTTAERTAPTETTGRERDSEGRAFEALLLAALAARREEGEEMASEENGKSAGAEPVEPLIYDLIRDIFSEVSQSAKTRARGGDSITASIETALASSQGTPKTSTIKRLLIAQVLASALADALAPALAETLAPGILKALEHRTTHSRTGGEKVSAPPSPRPNRGGRKKT